MSAPLTLPGDLPGLLRRGSPVFWRDEETPWTALYVWRVCDDDPQGGENVLAAPCSVPCFGAEDSAANFALDLSDPTGRVHAAWWARRQWWEHRDAPVVLLNDTERRIWRDLLRDAEEGDDMTDAQIMRLRDLCLRFAGRPVAS